MLKCSKSLRVTYLETWLQTRPVHLWGPEGVCRTEPQSDNYAHYVDTSINRLKEKNITHRQTICSLIFPDLNIFTVVEVSSVLSDPLRTRTKKEKNKTHTPWHHWEYRHSLFVRKQATSKQSHVLWIKQREPSSEAKARGGWKIQYTAGWKTMLRFYAYLFFWGGFEIVDGCIRHRASAATFHERNK